MRRGQALPISPAATLVLARGEGPVEILLVKRSSKQVFMPDFWVFPGGRVDATDAGGDAEVGGVYSSRVAALRETREETGLDLPPCELHEFARWVTPVGETRRYDTRFFLALVDGLAQAPRPDAAEVVEARWITASEALAAHCRGELALAPPTWWTFRTLLPLSEREALGQWAKAVGAAPTPVWAPSLETRGGRPAVCWDGGGVWLEATPRGGVWRLIE